MNKITHKVLVNTKTCNDMVLSLGALYTIKKPYTFLSEEIDRTTELLVLMPISLIGGDIIFAAIATNNEDDISMEVLPKEHLAALIVDTPSSESFEAYLGNNLYSIVRLLTIYSNIMVIQDTELTPTGLAIDDLRKWPRRSIITWANYQLGLEQEQIEILVNIQERWKMIKLAQEMFVHQCAQYNNIAKEKTSKEKISAIKKQLRVGTGEARSDNPMEFVGTCPDHRALVIDIASSLYSKLTHISDQRTKMDDNTGSINMVALGGDGHANEVRIIFRPSLSIFNVCYIESEVNSIPHDTKITREPLLYVDDLLVVAVNGIYVHILHRIPINRISKQTEFIKAPPPVIKSKIDWFGDYVPYGEPPIEIEASNDDDNTR